jgi:peptidoglycan-associated lipoprotein
MNGLNRKHAWYWMVVLLIGLAALSGCPKKAEITAVPEAQQEPTPAAEAAAPPEQKTEAGKSENDEARERAAAELAREQAAAELARERAAADLARGLQAVYFDFDQSFIRDEAREIMKANAEWLKAHPQTRIRIEGNCDERGTREYNQALGQRRAASAKKHLIDMGISGQRISLISYGKEKPNCTDGTESCWQKNRRDDFAVVTE